MASVHALPSPTPSHSSSRSVALLPPAPTISTTAAKDPADSRQPQPTRLSSTAQADALLLQVGRLARAADAGPAAGLLAVGRLPDELRISVLDAVSEALVRAVGGSDRRQLVERFSSELTGLDADLDAYALSQCVISERDADLLSPSSWLAYSVVALLRALAPTLVISRSTACIAPDLAALTHSEHLTDPVSKPAFGGGGLLSRVFSFFMPTSPAPAPTGGPSGSKSAASAPLTASPLSEPVGHQSAIAGLGVRRTLLFTNQPTCPRASEQQIKAEPQTFEMSHRLASTFRDRDGRSTSPSLPDRTPSVKQSVAIHGSFRTEAANNQETMRSPPSHQSPSVQPALTGSSSRPSDRRSPSAGRSTNGSASGGGQKMFGRPAWMDEALARRDGARSSGRPGPHPPAPHYPPSSHPSYSAHPPSGYPVKRPSSDSALDSDYYSRPPGPPPPPMPIGGFDGYDDGRFKRPRMDEPYAADWGRPLAFNDGSLRYGPPGGAGQKPPFPPAPPLPPPPPPMLQQPAAPFSGPPRQAPPPTKSISKSHCVRRCPNLPVYDRRRSRLTLICLRSSVPLRLQGPVSSLSSRLAHSWLISGCLDSQ